MLAAQKVFFEFPYLPGGAGLLIQFLQEALSCTPLNKRDIIRD